MADPFKNRLSRGIWRLNALQTATLYSFKTSDFFVRVALTWAAIAFVVGLINIGGILSARFPDPDDIMRLLQVRDVMGGQAWLDLHQYRVDAANGGVLMHWSRLVDIPLLLVIGALTPLLGEAGAEVAALTIVPLITLLISMMLTARIVWKVLGEEPITMTCIAMVLSVPLLFQLTPMRIDHHGWQIVGGLIAVNGIMAQRVWLGGLIAGLAMAAWLSISLEGLPLAAAICALMAWRWWSDARKRGWLAWVMAGLAGGSVLFYGLTKNVRGLVTFCDAIGPAHIAMFVFGAVVLGALAWANPKTRMTLLAGFALAGGGALALLFYTAPDCAGSSFSRLDPVLTKFWYEQVSEGLPLWHQTLSDALQIAVFPLLGILASLRFIRSSEGALKTFWIEYSALLLAAFLVAMLVARAGALAAALAAVPMGWQIAEWLRKIREMKRPLQRVLAMIALVAVLAPAMPVKAVQGLLPAQNSANLQISAKASACNIAESAKLLANLPKGEIFAPLDISPRLLLETHHSVVATGHHRGEKSMLFVIETLTSPADKAKKALQQRGSNYIALCPDLSEVAMYANSSPDGLAANLISGEAPKWLEPIALEGQNGLKAWLILPAK